MTALGLARAFGEQRIEGGIVERPADPRLRSQRHASESIGAQ
jgi:hypothetical protein